MVFVLPSLVPQAKAATGLVCIADPSLNPASCPASPPSLSGTVGSSVTVAVNIQGSDSLNGFDISVQVNPSVLQPTNVTFANSVIHSPNFVLTNSANSTTGIARLALVASGYVVTGPVTGNLFNINYKVLSSSIGTSIVFQAGCSGTSVPNICVTVVNPNIDTESVQTATFGGPITPDFSITANPISQNVQQGTNATSKIVLASLGGFASTVNLSTSPPRLCPSCPSWSVSPNTVTLISGGTGQATLSFLTTSGTPTLTFIVNVTGTSGSLSHNVAVKFTVVSPPPPPTPDFKISASPSSLSIIQGNRSLSSIILSSVSGFTGPVNQTLIVTPPGPGASVNPKIVLVPPNGSNSSTLTVTTTSSTAPGTYNVTVIGTSGSLSHSTSVTVVVTAPLARGTVCIAPVSSTSCPSTPSMFQGTVGGQLMVAVNVQNSAALNGFDIQVLTNPSILRPVSDSLSGTILQNLFVLANSVNSTTGLVRVAAVAQAFVTTAPTTGRFFSITYNIVGTTPGTFILFPNGCTGTSNGNTCVTVVNAGVVDPESILEANFTSTPPPDFTMSAKPSSLAIPAGTTATSTINITSINGFAGAVSLSTSTGPLVACPPNCNTWSISPTSVTLAPGGTASATLTITVGIMSTLNGFVTVFGTSGSLTHTANVVFTVPTITITANPTSITVRAGQSGSSALNVTSLNGFSGTVTLSTSIQPGPKRAPGISISPTTINLSSGGTATVTLVVSTNGGTEPGTYTVTVTATSGSLIQSVTLTVTVLARR
jgi:hypothetical protein